MVSVESNVLTLKLEEKLNKFILMEALDIVYVENLKV